MNTFHCLFFLFVLMACQTSQTSPTNKAPNFIVNIKANTIYLADGSTKFLENFSHPEKINFVLVRHAEKRSRSEDRLSEAGKTRALRLGELMEEIRKFHFVTTTKTYRTRGTAEPVNNRQPAKYVFYPADQQEEFFNEYIQTKKGKNIFVVGHSNTIPQLLNFFVGEEKYAQISEDEYDNIYFVELTKPGDAKVMELKY